jgi:sterol desaturase/sphingolipid hydroxylase (fatty acid hydroxylase superfamily)
VVSFAQELLGNELLQRLHHCHHVIEAYVYWSEYQCRARETIQR